MEQLDICTNMFMDRIVDHAIDSYFKNAHIFEEKFTKEIRIMRLTLCAERMCACPSLDKIEELEKQIEAAEHNKYLFMGQVINLTRQQCVIDSMIKFPQMTIGNPLFFPKVGMQDYEDSKFLAFMQNKL
jgi:hypothetical protein